MNRRLAAAASAALFAAAACAPKHKTQFRAAPTALAPVTCIAVLPFENLSGTTYAGDTLADLVATELLKSGRFQVMDRAESARILATRGIYLTATVDAAQARALGDVLGVQAVMLGAIDEYQYRVAERRDRPARATVGATVRLVDVKTGDALWGASFSGAPASFFGDSTPPLHVAAQRVAMDLSGGLLEGAGPGNASDKPCWSERAQSVLATLAPGAQGPSRATASASPTPAAMRTPIAVATPLPTATATATAVAMIATPAPTPAAIATPATKPLSAPQTALLEKMKPQAQFVLDGVAFSGVTTVLADSATAPLGDVAAVLAAHPEMHLRIEAHVDPTDAGPVPLSQKRSEQVVAKLIALGAGATQVEPKGMGGSKTLFPSFVEAMKAKNRRVEVVVTQGATTSAVAAATPAPGATPGAADPARVKVLASKGASASAVKLANTLKQGGTKVTAVAAVPEERKSTLVYFTPNFKTEAQKLATSISVPGGAKLSPATSLGAGVDIVILVGADLK